MPGRQPKVATPRQTDVSRSSPRSTGRQYGRGGGLTSGSDPLIRHLQRAASCSIRSPSRPNRVARRHLRGLAAATTRGGRPPNGPGMDPMSAVGGPTPRAPLRAGRVILSFSPGATHRNPTWCPRQRCRACGSRARHTCVNHPECGSRPVIRGSGTSQAAALIPWPRPGVSAAGIKRIAQAILTSTAGRCDADPRDGRRNERPAQGIPTATPDRVQPFRARWASAPGAARGAATSFETGRAAGERDS